jgi:hypothetical protein
MRRYLMPRTLAVAALVVLALLAVWGLAQSIAFALGVQAIGGAAVVALPVAAIGLVAHDRAGSAPHQEPGASRTASRWSSSRLSTRLPVPCKPWAVLPACCMREGPQSARSSTTRASFPDQCAAPCRLCGARLRGAADPASGTTPIRLRASASLPASRLAVAPAARRLLAAPP